MGLGYVDNASLETDDDGVFRSNSGNAARPVGVGEITQNTKASGTIGSTLGQPTEKANPVSVVTPVKDTTSSIAREDRNISLQHIIFFVTTWLQKVLCVKTLRHRGIPKKEIKKRSIVAAQNLVEGHRETKLRFNPTHKSKAPNAVIVLVSLVNIMDLQKHSLDSPVCQAICDSMVSSGISSLESSSLPEAESSFREKVSTAVNANASHCFALPFKTNDQSLLSADRFSSDLSSRLSCLANGRDIPSLSAYFENSLRDNIKRNAAVVHGMDFATLEPEKCLNDAVLNFWFKWVTTPRCPEDNTSS
eukprot:scaffold9845_cov87-Skeletonema_menzelii.AAC.1